MQLILVRHGNTFAAGDPVVWAGCKQDFPLVDKGMQQLESLADRFIELGYQPEAIYCSPLTRTRQSAEILKKKLGLVAEPIVDLRLNELNYGRWGGLRNDQIIELFGQEALDNWSQKSIWPTGADWGQSAKEIRNQTLAFMNYLVENYQNNQTVIAVSSNGRLRYFLSAIPGEFEARVSRNEFKVGTGKYCRLHFQDRAWQVKEWNA